MRKGMLAVAGSFPTPQLHREAKESTERNLSHGTTSWLSFVLCLSPFRCHWKVSPGEGAARTDVSVWARQRGGLVLCISHRLGWQSQVAPVKR